MAHVPRVDRRRAEATEPALAFGETRIGAGWLGITIAAATFILLAVTQIAAGNPAVLLAVGPILATFALACATTRRVRIDPSQRSVHVIWRLLGLEFTRRLPLARFGRVSVRMQILRPRLNRSPMTPAGNQMHAQYTVALHGRRRLRLATFHASGDPARARAAAETLAGGLARRLGLNAERDGYTVVAGADGIPLSLRRPGSVSEPLR